MNEGESEKNEKEKKSRIKNGIIKNMPCCKLLLYLTIMFLRVIHVGAMLLLGIKFHCYNTVI